MEYNEFFEKECDQIFWNILNFESSNLYVNCEEFIKESSECSKILDDYPNLRKVLDTKEIVSLNEDDVANLIKYLDADMERSIIEQKRIFFDGCKSAFVIMKKLNMIKEDEEKKD